MNQSKRIKKMVTVGMLSGISYMLMWLSFPLPLLPPFLSVDFSDVPALLAAILFGPVAGITVEAIKNILHYIAQGSLTGVPVGQLANFTAGLLFILPTYFVFNKIRSTKGLGIGLITGTFSMALLMSILNYFVFLPAFTYFLGIPFGTSADVIKLVVTGILPFNIIKGLIVTVLFLIVYKKLAVWMNRQLEVKNI
ncbi:Riboflavin transporter FmnP [Bacillus sp. THAF10]|uniref:ECF transporter S component n=1 Tax=Bacillus sp. THAF10 TaxID=2587848 RepID=UPI001267EB8D|nr:ECF transporter S component [Bacillus sp. THAF10]QFT89441.1 Riboflavin transporter FmnP [Bacillus sp. THAF10]